MPKLDEISNAATPSIAANTPVEADKRGNPGLLPERSLNFEAVLERYLDSEAGVLGGNLYVRSTRDFTERRVQLEGVRWVDRPFNEGSALHWGWELDGKLRADSLGWNGATVKAHLTLPHAQVNDARLGIPRLARDTPNYFLSAGLDESRLCCNPVMASRRNSPDAATDILASSAVYRGKDDPDAFWLRKLTPHSTCASAGRICWPPIRWRRCTC